MEKETKLSIKPFQIRFGPRDELPYADLIKHFSNIPEGNRARAAKDLMLYALRIQQQGGNIIPAATPSPRLKEEKRELEPSPIDAGLLPSRRRSRD